MRILDGSHIVDGFEFYRGLSMDGPFVWTPIRCLYGNWIKDAELDRVLEQNGNIEVVSFDSQKEYQASKHLNFRSMVHSDGYFCSFTIWPDWEDFSIWMLEKEELNDIIFEPCKCPACGGEMVQRNGRYGTFYGCSNFPRCSYSVGMIKNKTEYMEILIREDLRKAYFKVGKSDAEQDMERTREIVSTAHCMFTDNTPSRLLYREANIMSELDELKEFLR